ncbi:MAG: glycosyltransferase family 1 protein [Magnetococcales bacterium]|nr:glycosyltransferase family 1 protein [Magnetococcales bacterium]
MSETVPTLLEELLRLDATENPAELLQWVCSKPLDLNGLLAGIHHLLAKFRLRSAFVLGMLLAKNGYQHTTISLALSLGGLFYGKPEEEARGLAQLPDQLDRLSRKEQGRLYDEIVNPVVQQMLKPGVGRSFADDELLRLIEICKAAIPPLRPLFDWNAPVPALSLETLRQQGRARARLFNHPLPTARLRRRAVVFMKDFYIARRIFAAMQAHEWQVALHATPGWGITPQDCHTVLELCRQQDAELLVLYFDQVVSPTQAQAFHELLTQLRQEKPTLKRVVVACDAWYFRKGLVEGEPDLQFGALFQQLIGHVDAVWTSDSPSLTTWETPLFAGKVLHAHLPHAGHMALPDRPLIPQMLYVGYQLDWYLWPRMYWLLAAQRLGLPVVQKEHLFVPQTALVPKGDEALMVYGQHLQRLREATCCLHFTRKENLHCIVTHRSFEAPLNGALLVQEYAPDMHRFFIPGEHYLEFNSIAEFVAVSRFITQRREEAEEIRRSGNAFARAQYSDDKLLGYLEKFLWRDC